MSATWEVVVDHAPGCAEWEGRVRRLEVPGGWLYQIWGFRDTETLREGPDVAPSTRTEGWGAPTFVPSPVLR